MKRLIVKNKEVRLPIYLPDATRGVVRGLESNDLLETGVEGLVVNAYHLGQKPGSKLIRSLGGIKDFARWPGLLISDSGGFQLLSLIYQNQLKGKIDDRGVSFFKWKKRKKQLFTPEKSIQIQMNLGSDILICLDDCPDKKASIEENRISVERTIRWAKRSKDEFLKQLVIRRIKKESFPLLFAVIQGGNDKRLREKCAKELIKIGFDGFSFGGWPLDENQKINDKLLSFTASLMPDDLPKFALGVGKPSEIISCFRMGYNIFDCVLPTRDARHQRLYIFKEDPDKIDLSGENEITDFVYIGDKKYAQDPRPISQFCNCRTCQNYSRSYLYYLFELEDYLAQRLATIHNLRTYTKLIEVLRKNG